MKCNAPDCEEEATHLVVWDGFRKPFNKDGLPYCDKHSRSLLAITDEYQDRYHAEPATRKEIVDQPAMNSRCVSQRKLVRPKKGGK